MNYFIQNSGQELWYSHRKFRIHLLFTRPWLGSSSLPSRTQDHRIILFLFINKWQKEVSSNFINLVFHLLQWLVQTLDKCISLMNCLAHSIYSPSIFKSSFCFSLASFPGTARLSPPIDALSDPVFCNRKKPPPWFDCNDDQHPFIRGLPLQFDQV